MAQPKDKIKILLLNPYLGLGGTEKIIVNFLNFLKKYNTRIAVFNKRNSFFDVLINEKKIIDLNVNRARYSFIQIWKTLKNEKPHFIFSNQREMNIVICVLNFFLNLKSTIILREAAPIDNIPKKNLNKKIYLFFLKFIYKSCNGIIFNSENTKKSFLSSGFTFKNHTIINNPLLIRSEKIYLKKNSKIKTFITISRLDSQKNLFELIKIFHKYSIRNNNCQLMIVGSGILYNDIKNEIDKIKYKKKIILINQTLNVERYFKKADYYISCSKSEGFGNSYIEALAFNLPIISINNGGIQDIIKKSSQGHIVNNENYLNFISSINMINRKNFAVLHPGLKKFDKNIIFNKYLGFILSCKN